MNWLALFVAWAIAVGAALWIAARALGNARGLAEENAAARMQRVGIPLLLLGLALGAWPMPVDRPAPTQAHEPHAIRIVMPALPEKTGDHAVDAWHVFNLDPIEKSSYTAWEGCLKWPRRPYFCMDPKRFPQALDPALRATARELGVGEPVMGCPDPAYIALLVTDRLQLTLDTPIQKQKPATVIIHGQPATARLVDAGNGKEALGIAVSPLGAETLFPIETLPTGPVELRLGTTIIRFRIDLRAAPLAPTAEPAAASDPVRLLSLYDMRAVCP